MVATPPAENLALRARRDGSPFNSEFALRIRRTDWRSYLGMALLWGLGSGGAWYIGLTAEDPWISVVAVLIAAVFAFVSSWTLVVSAFLRGADYFMAWLPIEEDGHKGPAEVDGPSQW